MRLTPDEIARHKAHLSKWQTPSDMEAYYDEVNAYIGSCDLFNQAGVDFLTEACAAARFARFCGAQAVRLVDDVWPDFEIEIDGSVEQFELIEADLPGRRRGEEYREGIGEVEDIEEGWSADVERVPKILRSAVERKVAKHYSDRRNLLVYLNVWFPLSGDGDDPLKRRIEECFVSASEPAKNAFEQVWILWERACYRVWSGGTPSI